MKDGYYYSNECEEKAVCITEGAFCECCMELEPYTATISDGGTRWCIDCWEANQGELPRDVLAKIDAKETKQKIKYYEKKLKELQNKK